MAENLTNLDSYHVNAADEVGVQGGIHTIATLNDGANLLVDTGAIVSPSWHLSTLQEDGVSDPYLPSLELTAQTDYRITGDADLPGIQLTDMRVGIRSNPEDPWLPTVSSTATMQSGQVANLAKRLPAMTLSAKTGARADALKLPTIDVTMEMTGGANAGRLDKTLPDLGISATGSTPVPGTLDKDLPALTISAEASGTTTATLDKDIPGLKITASAISGASATLEANLPVVVMEYDEGSLTGDSMSLDVDLPAIVAALGTGSIPGLSGTLTADSRWTDYVMRHVR